MTTNMTLYERVRKAPDNALKTIQAGKLKGKSDINPMWRIKVLTEVFGPQGTGWKIENVHYWNEPGAGGEVMCFCSLDLSYKQDGEWSAAVPGIGGSRIVQLAKGTPESNDEGYKMAFTDALSVACKGLGVAADVYWNADTGSKYRDYTQPQEQQKTQAAAEKLAARAECQRAVKSYCQQTGTEDTAVWSTIAKAIGKASKDFTADDWRQSQKIVEGWVTQ